MMKITLNDSLLGADLSLRFRLLVFANHSSTGAICELEDEMFQTCNHEQIICIVFLH